VNTARPRLTWLLLPLLTFANQSNAAERWTVEQDRVDTGGESRPVAIVSAATGDTLRVFADQRNGVALSVRLRDGFERIDESQCPTLLVDDHPPMAPQRANDGCTTTARVVTVPLGRIVDGNVRSPLLARLIAGTELVWRVRLQSLGYRELRFTLRGSKQALVAVLGAATTVSEN
jgi:hypothetical protein